MRERHRVCSKRYCHFIDGRGGENVLTGALDVKGAYSPEAVGRWNIRDWDHR